MRPGSPPEEALVIRVHLLAVLVVMAPGVIAADEPSHSPAMARELVAHLEARHLEAFATVDPRASDRFIAVLYIPNSQLLVVGARHPATEALALKIQQQQFRDVYLDLQASPDISGKVFIHDVNADGLQRSAGTIPDNVYEEGKRITLINRGNVDADRLGRSEDEYERMLSALLAALASPPASAPGGQLTTK
jgi:hypothetical protein